MPALTGCDIVARDSLTETPMPASMDGFTKRTARLQADLVEQGRRVQSMLEGAFESLFEHNPERAGAVVAQDDIIDAADVEIERACIALLIDATREHAQLDTQQLRSVLTIAKV